MSFGQLRHIRLMTRESDYVDRCLAHLALLQSISDRGMILQSSSAAVVANNLDVYHLHSVLTQ